MLNMHETNEMVMCTRKSYAEMAAELIIISERAVPWLCNNHIN